jgi:hypothetical protein
MGEEGQARQAQRAARLCHDQWQLGCVVPREGGQPPRTPPPPVASREPSAGLARGIQARRGRRLMGFEVHGVHP